MAALNFPPSPNVGDLYPTPAVSGIAQWQWNGTQWVVVGSSVAYLPLTGGTLTGPLNGTNLALSGTLNVAGVTTLGVATAATPAPTDNSTNVATTAWVTAKGFASGSNFLPITGGTLTGPGNLTINGTLTGTTATFTGGYIIVSGTGNNSVEVDGASGNPHGFYTSTGGSRRWFIYQDQTAESGTNVGSNLAIASFDNSGNSIGYPLTINRASGLTTLTNLSAGYIADTGDAHLQGNTWFGNPGNSYVDVSGNFYSSGISYQAHGGNANFGGSSQSQFRTDGSLYMGAGLVIAGAYGINYTQYSGNSIGFGWGSGGHAGLQGYVDNTWIGTILTSSNVGTTLSLPYWNAQLANNIGLPTSGYMYGPIIGSLPAGVFLATGQVQFQNNSSSDKFTFLLTDNAYTNNYGWGSIYAIAIGYQFQASVSNVIANPASGVICIAGQTLGNGLMLGPNNWSHLSVIKIG